MSGSFSFGRNKSEPVVDPALLNPQNINEVISRIMGLTGQGPQTFSPVTTNIEQSPFFSNFQSALNDRFTPTAPENQLLENIMGQTSAQFARRGLGTSPIAASSTAASIAPSLVQMRQNQIEAIRQALQGDVAEQGSLSQLNLQSWLAKIQSLLSLLETAGKYQPLGQTSTQAGGKSGLLEGLPISFSYSNVGMNTPEKGVTN